MAQEEYRSRPQERPPARPQSGSREVPAGQGGGRPRPGPRGGGGVGAPGGGGAVDVRAHAVDA